MNRQRTHTLGKTERLKSRKLIDQLFKQGRSFALPPFRIMLMDVAAADEALKVAFSVSTRFFKKAVDRNRIRRLMRESWRVQKGTLQEQLNIRNKQIVVFIIYTDKALPQYQLIHEKMGVVIKRIVKTTNEKTAADT